MQNSDIYENVVFFVYLFKIFESCYDARQSENSQLPNIHLGISRINSFQILFKIKETRKASADCRIGQSKIITKTHRF